MRRVLAVVALCLLAPSVARACLDHELIRRVIVRQLAPVRRCYENAPNAKDGVIKARFVIVESGEVSSSELDSSTVNDPALERCVVDATRTFRFPRLPPGSGYVTIVYPFRFEVRGRE